MKSWQRLAAVVVAVVAALLISACGSPTTKASEPLDRTRKPAAYLCQVLPRVDRLTVTRRAPGHQFVFTFPAVEIVTSANAARGVASAACALSDIPAAVYHCPTELAVSYQLEFAVNGEKGMGGEAIDVYPTGCQRVAGLGATRVPTQSFYRLLAGVIGLTDYNSRTFEGTIPKGGEIRDSSWP